MEQEKFIWDILKEWKFERKEVPDGKSFIYDRYYGTFRFRIELIPYQELTVHCRSFASEKELCFQHKMGWDEIVQVPLIVFKKNLKFVIRRFMEIFLDYDFFGEKIDDRTLFHD